MHPTHRQQGWCEQGGEKAVRWSHICNDGNPQLVRVGHACGKCGTAYPVKTPSACSNCGQMPDACECYDIIPEHPTSLRESATAEKPYARIQVRAGDIVRLYATIDALVELATEVEGD